MTDRSVILLQNLLDAAPKFLSGNLLAEQLGVSRVAVWARLERLRKEGFAFEAVRRRGYRLTEEPFSLNATLIRAYLRRAKVKTPLLFFPEIDSTNTEAERQLTAMRPTPFVILASRQTEGRGRLGRPWYSPQEGNGYLSFAFRPDLPSKSLQTLTLWVSLNLCAFLNDCYDLPLRLKWPNDLVLKAKKVGGLLTEARVDTDHTRDLILGLGLNVNGRCQAWPSAIARLATSLAEAKGAPLPLNALLSHLMVTVLDAYASFGQNGWQEKLHRLWARYDAIGGQTITVINGTESLTGTAEGIDAEGALCLRGEHNRVIKLYAGEVTLGTRATLRPS